MSASSYLGTLLFLSRLHENTFVTCRQEPRQGGNCSNNGFRITALPCKTWRKREEYDDTLAFLDRDSDTYNSMFPLLSPCFTLSFVSLSQHSVICNMLLSLINALLLTAAFTHAVPPQRASRPLTEAELDKLYPKCWVDVSTKQGTILYNVPGRCQVKREGWKKIFTQTISIAGGCGEQLLVVFPLNYNVFQTTLG